MSYSEIMIFGKDGAIVNRTEFHNSHGFVPFVYCSLVDKYREHLRPLPPHSLFVDQWAALWDWLAVSGTRLPAFEMNTLAAMSDTAYVRGTEHILRLAKSFEMFEEKYFVEGHTHHLAAMATVMREYIHTGAEYVAFYQSNVVDCNWYVGTRDGGRRLINFTSSRDKKNVGAARVRVADTDGPSVVLGGVADCSSDSIWRRLL